MVISVEVRVGPWLARLPEILAAKPEFQEKLMHAVGERGKDIARAEAPTRTGHLQSTIDYEVTSATGIFGVEPQVRIVCRALYALPVEYGARPHFIRPRTVKALRVNDRVFKKVFHPGTRPNPFMLRTRNRMIYDSVDLTLRHVDVWLQL